MAAGVEIPIYADGRPTGRTVSVPDPPPERWLDGDEPLELHRVEVLTRFGCGCIRELVPAYVAAASSSEASRIESPSSTSASSARIGTSTRSTFE
jgi:hypothetical protein